MEFLLPEELVSFENSLRQFFSKHISSKVVRSACIGEDGLVPELDQTLWRELAEMGLFAAPVAEDLGGLGMGVISAELILGLAGEFLAPAPIFETLGLGTAILSNIDGSEHCRELLERAAAGEAKLSAAFEQLIVGEPAATASSSDEQCTISGNFSLCPSVGFADTLIVPAKYDGRGIALYSVETADSELTASPCETFDCIRPYFSLELRDVKAKRLTAGGLDENSLNKLRDIICLCAAAEMTGAAKRALTMSVDYAQTRTQFGKPIGSFQAIAHKLADMHVQVESSKALVRFAAWACDNDEKQRTDACRAAKAYASGVCPKVAQDAIQAHGGIGFTYEYDLHLFLRRIRCLCALYGTASFHSQYLGAETA